MRLSLFRCVLVWLLTTGCLNRLEEEVANVVWAFVRDPTGIGYLVAEHYCSLGGWPESTDDLKSFHADLEGLECLDLEPLEGAEFSASSDELTVRYARDGAERTLRVKTPNCARLEAPYLCPPPRDAP